MKKKSLLSLVLVGTLAFTGIVGCGTKEEASKNTNVASSKGPIEVNFWHALGGKNGEVLKSLVDKFNSSQNDVKVVETQQGSYWDNATKLQAALVAGNQPDLETLEVTQLGQFAASNAIADLSPYFSKDDISKFQDGLVKNSYVDNKFLAMPFNRSTPILYINKDILKKAGLDENGPKNWDELEKFSKTIAEKVPGVKGYETPIDIWFIQAGIFQQGGKILSDDGKQVTFKEEGTKLLQKWQDMVKEGAMVAPAGQDYDAWEAADNDFLSGKVAMIQDSTGSLSKLLEQSKGKFEMNTAFLPAEKQYGVPTGGANIVMMQKSSKEKKDAAAKFMKFLSEKDNAAAFSKGTGYMPTTKEAVQSDDIKKLYDEHPQYKVALDQLQYAGVVPMVKGYREMTVKIQEQFKKALVDPNVSVKDTIDTTIKQVEDLVKQNQ